jgi:hypothetical protein
VTQRQLLLQECCECGLIFRGTSADSPLHELRREADSLSLAKSSPGHSQESASWPNIGSKQWDRYTNFLLPERITGENDPYKMGGIITNLHTGRPDDAADGRHLAALTAGTRRLQNTLQQSQGMKSYIDAA